MIERNDSQQTTCSAHAVINGERRQVASATCSFRPGRTMNISIDILPEANLAENDMAEIAAMFGEYLTGEIRKAAGMGIPVALPEQ